MTTVDLKTRGDAAIAELNRLCNGEPFKMSIPVQDTDSDQIIGAALLNIGEVLAELDRLRAIEDAARVAADMTVIPVGERTFGKVSVRVMGIRKVLRDALAAFDAAKGDTAT
jgi:hypothetical protein